MTKRILMIAFHFPPLAGSSGIQRTLRFVQHLPAFGWEPIVLTITPRAYERVSDDLLREVPSEVVVHRALGFDTARHLAVLGRYPAFLARPDRWMTWQFAGRSAGEALVAKYRPSIVWSTYPIATAHVIGAAIHRSTGLPWVADFRDPMAQDGYPADPATWQSYKRIEETALRGARFSVFTTSGAARIYGARYPDAAARCRIIENGFDEESFAGLSTGSGDDAKLNPGAITLLHSGVVYPSERDPEQLFMALADLDSRGAFASRKLIIRFRASGHDAMLTELARKHGVLRFIELKPALPYRAALEEMMRADGLLVLQASNCNEQVPAKLYEYLRARRPILALTDPVGDTAGVLRRAGIDAIAPLDSAPRIAASLLQFLDDVQCGSARLASPADVEQASRRARSRDMAALLDECVASA